MHNCTGVVRPPQEPLQVTNHFSSQLTTRTDHKPLQLSTHNSYRSQTTSALTTPTGHKPLQLSTHNSYRSQTTSALTTPRSDPNTVKAIVVLIESPTGMGKTKLLQEMKNVAESKKMRLGNNSTTKKNRC